MSYSDNNILRPKQADQGLGTDLMRAKIRNGKTYQVVMPNEVDGTWVNAGSNKALLNAPGGVLYQVNVVLHNLSSPARFCIVDTNSIPENGLDVIDHVYLTQNQRHEFRFPGGLPFTNGIGLVLYGNLISKTIPSDSFYAALALYSV